MYFFFHITGYLLLFCCLFTNTCSPASLYGETEKKVALVIGNSAYSSKPLETPVNDSRSITKLLRRVGFSVMHRENTEKDELLWSIRDFGKSLSEKDVGLFFYSGQGASYLGKNYLVPVGKKISHPWELHEKAVDLHHVLAEMEASNSRANILILDACREKPVFPEEEGAISCLASMDAPPGSFIAFSTSPGYITVDGPGKNSLYVGELIRFITCPGLRIADIFNRVRKAVRRKSKSLQVPMETTSLETPLFFVPPDPLIMEEKRFQENKRDVRKRPVLKTEWVEPVTGMNFIRVEGGCYNMGCETRTQDCEPDEFPIHDVCLDSFWMGTFEVTNRQYALFLNDTERKKTGIEKSFRTRRESKYSGIRWNGRRYVVIRGYEKRPVVEVSWYGARAFAKWLSRKTGKHFDIPSEAQWEYACRNCGSKTAYPVRQADEERSIETFAWFSKHEGKWYMRGGAEKPFPVGLKKPNGIGLYDMSGNVWEWCLDVYASRVYEQPVMKNPVNKRIDGYRGKKANRVIRGGSYLYGKHRARCSNRGNCWLAERKPDVGFRIVLNPDAGW